VAVLYLGSLWLAGGDHNIVIDAFGILAGIIAVATVFSTGMIYACLKTMRQWNTSLTPANYLLMGLAVGSTLMAVVTPSDAFVQSTAVFLLAAAAVMKAVYYFWIGRPKGATINTATGFTRAAVKLLDVGHTSGTFLTKEFGYEVPAGFVGILRGVVFLLGFALPAYFVGVYPVLAVVFAFIGIGVERWLFFAEARHVVMLYHGYQHT
jgi:DMSO reductase anchor subunit